MTHNDLLGGGVAEVIVREELERQFASGRKLRVKFGVDPTAPDLHLGHTVPLRKLRQFQDAGHQAVLIIGDFTAMIGDPTGHSEARQPLTEDAVRHNMQTYLRQAGKVIDLNHCEVRYNSEWLQGEGVLQKILELFRTSTIQQVLHRADFKKRLAAGEDLTLLEIQYPLFQGYDSVMVKADVEIGGTDQKFNLLMGRQVQRHYQMSEQNLVITPLLEGTDGFKKMSKSVDNYIGLDEPPQDMFGKLMAVPDALMPKYFELLTDISIPLEQHPRDTKLLLAERIVTMYHGQVAAQAAAEHFLKVFSRKEKPTAMTELPISNTQLPILELLLKAGIKSKSEARRLIEQGGVKINDDKKIDPEEILTLQPDSILQIGKRGFFRIRW